MLKSRGRFGRSRSPLLGTFAAGLLGGVLLAGAQPFGNAKGIAVNRVAGSDPGAAAAGAMEPVSFSPAQEGRIARSMDGAPSPAPAEPTTAGLPHRPRLTPQEIARKGMQWTVSIRGGGVYGAGILVDTRGYVLTNHHVIAGVEKLRVSFPDTEEMPATVVDFDKDLDLALLKVDVERPVAAPPAPFLDALVGDDVFAIGSPRKMNFTMSRGMVSYVGRKIDGRYYLQSDLPTNDGNSGGPVVNERGEVVGVMTFILRDSQGLAFAIPMDYAYERFAHVLKNERISLSRFQRWLEERDAATAKR